MCDLSLPAGRMISPHKWHLYLRLTGPLYSRWLLAFPLQGRGGVAAVRPVSLSVTGLVDQYVASGEEREGAAPAMQAACATHHMRLQHLPGQFPVPDSILASAAALSIPTWVWRADP